MKSITNCKNHLLRVLSVAGLAGLLVSAVSASPIAEIQIKEVSPYDASVSASDIYTEVSSGLNVVALGTLNYFQAVSTSTTLAGSYHWSIGRRPYGSVAQPDPATGEVTTFRPDVEGVYSIILTPYDQSDNPTEAVSQTLYVGTWIDAGVFDTHEPPDDSIPHCGNACCHKENADSRLNVEPEWIQSAHASILKDVLNGLTGHYRTSCLECHTVGFNEDPQANNNGFDDVAREINFDLNQIPIWATDAYNNGTQHWPDLPAALQSHANIQCENCHGPGSQHLGNILKGDHGIGGVNLDVGQCAQCHDEPPNHATVRQWNASAHPLTATLENGAVSQSSSCTQCHTGEGFVDQQIDGGSAKTYENPHGATCSTCHDPHFSDFPHQLRIAGDSTLADGLETENAGLGGLCMRCHNGRHGDAENTALTSRRGIHEGPQADMLYGETGVSFGLPFNGNSAHTTIVPDTCVHCHMATATNATDGSAATGGHTFNMELNGVTNVVNACDGCHPGLDTYDRPARGDYDGDGTIDGIQDEVKGLLALLKTGIINQLNSSSTAYTLSDLGGILVSSNDGYAALSEDLRRAIYNYNFVIQDRSFGVHNTSYAVQLLQRSYYGAYGHSILDDFPNIDLRGPVQASSLTPTPSPTAPPSPTATPPGPAPLGVIQILGVSPRMIDLDNTGVFDEVASGLNVVGKGTKVYMQGVAEDSSVTGFSWDIKSAPNGSSAQLQQVTGDMVTFRPDVEGTYQIELVSHDANGPLTPTFVQRIYATVWAGAGVFDTHNPPNPVAPECGTTFCHGGGNGNPDLNVEPIWVKSLHAQKLQLHLAGAFGSHYSVSCLPCHTVGFDQNPNAVNNGFDDVANDINYPLTKIPDLVTSAVQTGIDQWPNLPEQLQNLSSIQCENCHGAGSLHPANLTAPDRGIAGANLDVKQCAQCHDSASGSQQIVWQWSNSEHPNTNKVSSSVVTSTTCVPCHTGEGFVDVQVKGYPATIHDNSHGQTCAACHDPHWSKNPHQLRVVGDFTLPSGDTFYGPGMGGICIRCHNSRVSDAESTALTSTRGSHHGPQADMLLGVSGVSFGLPFAPNSPHGVVVPDLCVHCHMAPPTESGHGIITPPLVGGHTWSMRDEMGTPDDQSDDVINVVNACDGCHQGLDTYDYPAGEDFDGDGIAEGVQTEVKGLLTLLRTGILSTMTGTSVSNSGTISISSSNFANLTDNQKRALYNYNFVWQDGSFGVHNTDYAVQLLQRSYFGVYGRSIIEDYPNITLVGPVQQPGAGTGQPDLWMAH